MASVLAPRWWIQPGEVASTVVVDGKQSDLVFESDDGTLWEFRLGTARFGWDHIFHYLAYGADRVRVDDAVRSALKDFGWPREAWQLTTTEQAVLDAVARGLHADDWISARKLRQVLRPSYDLDEASLLAVVKRLHPRYLEEQQGDRGPFYAPTFGGLLRSSEAADAQRVVETVMVLLRREYQEDADFPSYTLDEVIAEGRTFEKIERRFVHHVILRSALCLGGGGSRHNGIIEWRYDVPDDIDAIADCQTFADFMSATQRGSSAWRCWPTAPRRIGDTTTKSRFTPTHVGSPPPTNNPMPDEIPNTSALKEKIVSELRKRADENGEVRIVFSELAASIGGGDVHLALLQLKDDGFFPGNPRFESDRFNGRLPAAPKRAASAERAPQSRRSTPIFQPLSPTEAITRLESFRDLLGKWEPAFSRYEQQRIAFAASGGMPRGAELEPLRRAVNEGRPRVEALVRAVIPVRYLHVGTFTLQPFDQLCTGHFKSAIPIVRDLISQAIGAYREHAATETTANQPTEQETTMADPKKVFVIHGRNCEARKQLGIFLKSMGLIPINFDDLRASMGGTPTIADIVKRGMDEAQGAIALFTPDEYAVLRPEHRSALDKGPLLERWQARPNVLFEAGMAFGRDRDRVVFVKLGHVELFTDVAGIHSLSPTNDPKGHRNVLRKTLKGMKCDVNDSSDWMEDGDFETCVKGLSEAPPLSPFVDRQEGTPPVRAPGENVDLQDGPSGAVSRSPPSSLTPRLSTTTENVMARLAEQYALANYPSHRAWNFTFSNDDPVAAELRALGLIEMMGTKGPDGTRWRLTDAGQRRAMDHRQTEKASPEAGSLGTLSDDRIAG